MPGRRVHSNQQITDWLEGALWLLHEIAPPTWAMQDVFAALLQVQQMPNHVYTDEEGCDAIQDALAIVESFNLPASLRSQTFKTLLSLTSALEQVQILKDIPGLREGVGKLQ